RDRTVTGVQTCALPIWVTRGCRAPGASAVRASSQVSRGGLPAGARAATARSWFLPLRWERLGHTRGLAPGAQKCRGCEELWRKEIGRAACRESGAKRVG